MPKYYLQINRTTGAVAFALKCNYEPPNTNETYVLREITEEEYEAAVSAMLEQDETEGAENDGE